MQASSQPISGFTSSTAAARRFILSHHYLLPARQLSGKEGVLRYIQEVGHIQFDPINIVGRNPDLVLQSRVRDYKPSFLDELLYADRALIDGWDKMASIYQLTDWPNFTRNRDHARAHPDARKPPEQILHFTLAEIKKRGPLSSLEFKESEIVDWHWGPTKAVRAAMEYLFSRGYLGVDHRVNNRRYFDLIENLLPDRILSSPDPFATLEAYQEWHILRRIGSMGLAAIGTGDIWGGILGIGGRERRKLVNKLVDDNQVTRVTLKDNPNQPYYIRTADLANLQSLQEISAALKSAAFIAPLDNLIWNRRLVESLFDFKYRWEVYKPKSKRQYGYYVLPVLYSDRFIARIDPAFDKKKRILTLNNWWWEEDEKPNSEMTAALITCVKDFLASLNASEIILTPEITKQPSLNWLKREFV